MVPKYLGPEEFGYGGVIGVSLFCFLLSVAFKFAVDLVSIAIANDIPDVQILPFYTTNNNNK